MNDSFSPHVIAIMRYRCVFLEGKQHGIDSAFSRFEFGELPEGVPRYALLEEVTLQELLKQREAALSAAKDSPANQEAEYVYNLGCVEGLIYSLGIISSKELSLRLPGSARDFEKPVGILLHQHYFYAGMMAGFLFFLENMHRMDDLNQEIEKVAERLQRQQGAMRFDTGPRYFQEGYLVGLQEVHSILLDVDRLEEYPTLWKTDSRYYGSSAKRSSLDDSGND